jgi:hypothetical protein
MTVDGMRLRLQQHGRPDERVEQDGEPVPSEFVDHVDGVLSDVARGGLVHDAALKGSAVAYYNSRL